MLRILIAVFLAAFVVAQTRIAPEQLRSAGAIQVSFLADLPARCVVGEVRYVPDASTSTGLSPLWHCPRPDIWVPLGWQADGTGLLQVSCDPPGFCLVGPNTAATPK